MERLCLAEETGLLHRESMVRVMFSVKNSHILIDRG